MKRKPSPRRGRPPGCFELELNNGLLLSNSLCFHLRRPFLPLRPSWKFRGEFASNISSQISSPNRRKLRKLMVGAGGKGAFSFVFFPPSFVIFNLQDRFDGSPFCTPPWAASRPRSSKDSEPFFQQTLRSSHLKSKRRIHLYEG